MNELQQNIIKWAEDKGIFEKSDPTSQFLKTIEELGELASAVNKNDLPEIKDAIGDVAVTLVLHVYMTGNQINLEPDYVIGYEDQREAVVNLFESLSVVSQCKDYDYGVTVESLAGMASYYGWTLQECLQSAYNVISKRTGKMENGVFVKDR